MDKLKKKKKDIMFNKKIQIVCKFLWYKIFENNIINFRLVTVTQHAISGYTGGSKC